MPAERFSETRWEEKLKWSWMWKKTIGTPHGSSLQGAYSTTTCRDDPWGVHHCRAVLVENLSASNLKFSSGRHGNLPLRARGIYGDLCIIPKKRTHPLGASSSYRAAAGCAENYFPWCSLLTDSLARPFLRRAESTRRPFLVCMRRRKPCLLTRLRLWGWNVRFMFLLFFY